MSKIKVLMTGAGSPGGPGIIKVLRLSDKIDLVVADADEYACGRFLNDSFELIPKANDVNFIHAVERICALHKIDIIFPLVTRELFHFANYKHEFLEKGIKVIVSDNDSLQISNNKRKLYQHLEKHKINVPEFYVVNDSQQFEEAALKLGYPEKIFCFKPSVGNGSIGFRIVSDEVDEHKILFELKPNSKYINYEKAMEILSSQSFPELLVTEYLPGDEYTIDTIVKNGEPLLILPRKRTQMREGISIKGEFTEHTEIIDYCRQILKSLDLHGPIGIQVKQAEDGTFRILEMNPRIQGTSVAALGMNINLPLIAVLQEFGLGQELLPEKISWGTKFIRYYQEVYYS